MFKNIQSKQKMGGDLKKLIIPFFRAFLDVFFEKNSKKDPKT